MDIVDRLFHQLRRALERGDPGAPGRALTIGDVYQHLIPYRALRDELGIWELAEYEHGLLRLLAGERGYLAVEAREVREEILRELASPNPILGIYRDYPAVQLRLRAADDRATEAADPPVAPDPAPPPLPDDSPAAEAPPSPACRDCGSDLPDAPDLRFCPICGQDQTEVRCRACDAPLKPEWNYCIRCGEPRDGGARREHASR